jgi:hypothetical protein
MANDEHRSVQQLGDPSDVDDTKASSNNVARSAATLLVLTLAVSTAFAFWSFCNTSL